MTNPMVAVYRYVDAQAQFEARQFAERAELVRRTRQTIRSRPASHGTFNARELLEIYRAELQRGRRDRIPNRSCLYGT